MTHVSLESRAEFSKAMGEWDYPLSLVVVVFLRLSIKVLFITLFLYNNEGRVNEQSEMS